MNGKGEIPAATGIPERNHIQRLISGTRREIVKVVEVVPHLAVVALQRRTAGADGILEIGQRLGIKYGLLEFGIAAQADCAEIARPLFPVVRADGVAGSSQGNTRIQALGEDLVDAVGARSLARSPGIRQIRDGLVQISQNLFVDHIPAAPGQINLV